MSMRSTLAGWRLLARPVALCSHAIRPHAGVLHKAWCFARWGCLSWCPHLLHIATLAVHDFRPGRSGSHCEALQVLSAPNCKYLSRRPFSIGCWPAGVLAAPTWPAPSSNFAAPAELQQPPLPPPQQLLQPPKPVRSSYPGWVRCPPTSPCSLSLTLRLYRPEPLSPALCLDLLGAHWPPAHKLGMHKDNIGRCGPWHHHMRGCQYFPASPATGQGPPARHNALSCHASTHLSFCPIFLLLRLPCLLQRAGPTSFRCCAPVVSSKR